MPRQECRPYEESLAAAVVGMLKEWGYNETEDAVTLAVGWGHDLIEDTEVTEAEIVAAGGEAVLAGDAGVGWIGNADVLARVPGRVGAIIYSTYTLMKFIFT